MNRSFWCFGAVLTLVATAPLSAQQSIPAPRRLSLDAAVALAEPASEVVGIAEAGVQRARGAQAQARSSLFPQVSANASYTRTLQSQFEGAFGSGSDTSSSGPKDMLPVVMLTGWPAWSMHAPPPPSPPFLPMLCGPL